MQSWKHRRGCQRYVFMTRAKAFGSSEWITVLAFLIRGVLMDKFTTYSRRGGCWPTVRHPISPFSTWLESIVTNYFLATFWVFFDSIQHGHLSHYSTFFLLPWKDGEREKRWNKNRNILQQNMNEYACIGVSDIQSSLHPFFQNQLNMKELINLTFLWIWMGRDVDWAGWA